MVDEPTVEDTISILRGSKRGTKYSMELRYRWCTCQCSGTFNRYISDRFLPDKAIDLVDEACAMIKTELDSMPAELDEITVR